MSELTQSKQVGEACPRRLWVMSTLTDDERLEATDRLPQALQFHISRCEACQALADELLPATRSLLAMGQSEPPGDLLAAAQAQAVAAIDRGAELTGRVVVPDLEEPLTLPPAVRIPMRSFRYAAAAVILIGFASFWIVRNSGPQLPVVSGQNSWDRSPPAVESPHDVPMRKVDTVRVDVVAGEPEVDTQLAASTSQENESGKRRRNRRICDQKVYDESTLLGDGDCVPTIRVRPDTRQRNLGWGGIFDRPAPNGRETRLLGNDASRRR